jgi:hypothetical protein
MGNENRNNFSTAYRRAIKLHKFNRPLMLNNIAVTKTQISKSKMAADAILKFYNFTKI